jgi:hypothetical protein
LRAFAGDPYRVPVYSQDAAAKTSIGNDQGMFGIYSAQEIP